MTHPAPKDMEIYGAETDDLLASQHRDPLLRHLTAVVVRYVVALAPAAGKVLDAGCGVGRTSIALAAKGFRVSGVDPSPRAVQLATTAAAEAGVSKTTQFSVGDATAELPLAMAGAYDCVVCSEVVEHVLLPERVVAYAHAALKPGGAFILTTPHDRAQWTVMDEYAGHVTRFSRAEIERLLDGQFDLISLQTEGFPFQRVVMRMYDARLKRSGQRHDFHEFRDTVPYRTYVAAMPWLLAIDHLLRGLGRGTTIVAVARRR